VFYITFTETFQVISAGIHVVVAAGNYAEDTSQFSPARVPSAITVAASNISDGAAFFSNYGSAVDLYAPGVNIRSTWTNGTTVCFTEPLHDVCNKAYNSSLTGHGSAFGHFYVCTPRGRHSSVLDISRG
jgi:subtilisin family serine protease